MTVITIDQRRFMRFNIITALLLTISALLLPLNKSYATSNTHSHFYNTTVLSDASLVKLSKIAALHLDFPVTDKKYNSFSKNQMISIFAISLHFERDEFEGALKIAWCESRLNSEAVNKRNSNGSIDYGLFQLNDGGTMQRLGVDKESANDPFVNAKAAKVLFDDRGWKPWYCKSKMKL